MRVLGFIIFVFYRLLIASWRIQIIPHPKVAELLQNNQPFILAHWHADIQALLHLMLRMKVVAMISRSKDGDLVAQVAELLGGKTARGSSSKGGVAALKEMIRIVRKNYIPALAIDGPRGPARVPKFGVFELAKICQLPIVPIGVISEKSYTFKNAWDGGYIPYPFSRITIYYAEPLAAPTSIATEDHERLPQLLATHMYGAKQHVANLIAARNHGC